MEACKIKEHLKYLNQVAVTLSTEERMQLEYALDQLQGSMSFERLYLWGKISGIETDYYVAVGMNSTGRKNFPERRFFWCQPSTWTFSMLKAPQMEFMPIFDQIQTFFSGESDKVIVQADGHCVSQRLREGSCNGLTLPAMGLTEQDRLSYVIHCIDRQCSVVPVGSMKKTPLCEVMVNEAFRGLKFDQLSSLDSFMHLRAPCQQEKCDMAAREDDIYAHDFLDNAAMCKPDKSWTVKCDEINHQVVVLRNRLFPGFFSYARANTAICGNLYMGNGLKNVDLPFMI